MPNLFPSAFAALARAVHRRTRFYRPPGRCRPAHPARLRRTGAAVRATLGSSRRTRVRRRCRGLGAVHGRDLRGRRPDQFPQRAPASDLRGRDGRAQRHRAPDERPARSGPPDPCGPLRPARCHRPFAPHPPGNAVPGEPSAGVEAAIIAAGSRTASTSRPAVRVLRSRTDASAVYSRGGGYNRNRLHFEHLPRSAEHYPWQAERVRLPCLLPGTRVLIG